MSIGMNEIGYCIIICISKLIYFSNMKFLYFWRMNLKEVIMPWVQFLFNSGNMLYFFAAHALKETTYSRDNNVNNLRSSNGSRPRRTNWNQNFREKLITSASIVHFNSYTKFITNYILTREEMHIPYFCNVEQLFSEWVPCGCVYRHLIGLVCTRVGQRLAIAPRPLTIYCASPFD
jgi:hypothetical protein